MKKETNLQKRNRINDAMLKENERLTREELANKGYLERDSAYNDYKRGEITEREYIDFCEESYKRQGEAGRTDEHKATYEANDQQPISFHMIEGEGAPQYTFALDTTTEPVQLALL